MGTKTKNSRLETLAAIDDALKTGALRPRMYDDLHRFTVDMEGKARFHGGTIAISFWERTNLVGTLRHFNVGVYVGGNMYRCTAPLPDEEFCAAWYEHFRQHVSRCWRLFGGHEVELPPWRELRAKNPEFHFPPPVN